MLHIKSLEEGLDIFKALGSEVRLVVVSNESAGHGNQKKCSVCLDKILIDMGPSEELKNVYQTDLKVGHFSDYEVYPTCGLASADSINGQVDDNRYFSHPDRYSADILWFTRGYVEYVIPNFIPSAQKIDQITISLEISSEAPGVNDIWPSDISFLLNDRKIAAWTSPGDFGDVRGLFTPDWWYPNWNQYGLLKNLVINRKGTFIDGLQVSDVSIQEFHLDYRSTLKLKLEVEEDAEHVGGLTIFGKNFGNYNQDISVHINYSPIGENE